MDLFYSTGQVAEAVGTTQENVRRLCQSGAIRAELTPGGQYRVPQEEYERLLREGLPTVPRPLPGDKGRPSVARSGTPPPGLLAEPSETLVQSAEEVAQLAYRAKSLRLQRRIDTEADYSRKREARIEQERRDEEEAIHARQAALNAQRDRAQWLQRWEEQALRSLPYNATPQTRLEVHQQVRARLSGLDPLPTATTVQSLIRAIIDEAMRVAKCREESHDIIERLMMDLPYDLKYSKEFALERDAALTLMGEALERLPVDASVERKQATARLALEPVMVCYRHQLARQALLNGLYGMIPRANQAEKQGAWKALAAALQQVPVGANQTTLEGERDRVVAGVMEKVENREEDERRRATEEERRREEASRRSAAEYKAASVISQVDVVLQELEGQGVLEFDGLADQVDVTRRMREKVSPLLVEQLLKQPELSTDQVKKRIAVLVGKNLSAVVPD